MKTNQNNCFFKILSGWSCPRRYVTISALFVLLSVQDVGAQSMSINTSGAIPDSSAMLDIISADKGLLIPRVNLTSTTDSATIVHPAISLQVYNTNDSMTGGGKGFWYWSGTQWKRVSSDGIENVWGTTGNAGTLTGTNFIGTTDNADWLIKTNNTERIRVLSGGNVGIGTITPASKLDIEGGISIGASYSGTTAAPANGAIIEGKLGIGTNSPVTKLHAAFSSSATLVGGATDGILFQNTNSTTNAVNALFFANSGGYSSAAIYTKQSVTTNNGDNLILETKVSGATWNNNQLVLNTSGNVGIGTTSPAKKLSVKTSNAVGDIRLGNDATIFGDIGFNGVTGTWIFNSQIGAGTPANFNYFDFKTDNTSRVVIKGNGLVGIGTTTPVNTLDIEGRIAIGASYSGTSTAPTNGAIIEGNVGIGTSIPAEKLEVNTGNILLTDNYALSWGYPVKPRGSLRTFSSSPYRGMRYYARCQAPGWQGVHDFYTQIDTATDVLTMRLVNSRMGLQTTTPNSTLQVAGTISLPYREVSSNTTASVSDYTLDVTTSCTVTLPTAVSITGRIYYIKANGVNVTIATTSGQTIDGLAPTTLTSGKGLMVQSNGSNWIKIITN